MLPAFLWMTFLIIWVEDGIIKERQHLLVVVELLNLILRGLVILTSGRINLRQQEVMILRIPPTKIIAKRNRSIFCQQEQLLQNLTQILKMKVLATKQILN